MRLIDVVGAELDGVDRVVDATAGSLELWAALDLPEGVEFDRIDGHLLGPGTVGPATLLVDAFGLEPDVGASRAAVMTALRGLRAGGRAVLVFGDPLDVLDHTALLATLAETASELVDVVPVDDGILRSALVVRAADPVARDALAAANAARLLGAAVETLHAGAVAANAEAAQRSEDLARQLRARELEAQAAVARLERVETSPTFQLGRALVAAGRSPRRAALLPRDLYRIWRHKQVGAPPPPSPAARRALSALRGRQAPSVAGSNVPAAAASGPERLYLAHRAVTIRPRTRLSIAAIVRPDVFDALAHDADINQMTPNDALAVVDRTDPDLVLIESRAFAAGNPWAYAGSLTAIDRDVRLVRAVEAARAAGRPVVLWRDATSGADVGLAELEGMVDLVLPGPGARAGDRPWWEGVQLATFNPIAAPFPRDPRPAFVGPWPAADPPSRRALLEDAIAGLADTGVEIWSDAHDPVAEDALPAALRPFMAGRVTRRESAALYRERAVFLAAPFTTQPGRVGVGLRSLRQLGAGARVVSGPNEWLERSLGRHIHIAADAGSAVAGVREELAAPPRTDAELRRVLRDLYRDHATRVRLQALATTLGIRTDPLHERRIAILACPDDRDDLAAIATGILRQRERPSQVVIAARADVTGDGPAEGGLRAAGIDVVIVGDVAATASWDPLIEAAGVPWVTTWRADRQSGTATLLDLAVAAECSRADAVGYVHDHSGFGATLAFDQSIVRRDVLLAARRPGGSVPDDLRAIAALGRRSFGLVAPRTRAEPAR